MSKLYASPLRVYLLLGALAIIGIICGLKLPVSLYPNSSKPRVYVGISFGTLNAEEFLNTYGRGLEDSIRALSTKDLKVEKVAAQYSSNHVWYDVDFKWGADPTTALREMQSLVNSYSARFPQEIRESVNINSRNENSGFFAVSFFSEIRSMDDLYDTIEPLLTPKTAKVSDAEFSVLYNPNKKEIRVELNPNAMAVLQLFPRDVEEAILGSVGGRGAGSITMGYNQLNVEMPRQIGGIEELNQIPIATPSGKTVHLNEIATVDYGPASGGNRSFRTNGAASLILFAMPKQDGNIKRMSEELLVAVKEIMPSLPKDIQYKVLVDPSEFIRSAINNVLHEVIAAAMLAVVVLFLFIGSFRNVITAAIEIPLSMVLAFILMRISGMNLNLISLGGLALSAGMNVDASVVVMENIFRHFEKHKEPLSFDERLRILVQAVNEVKFPIVASTIASLVVFIPLAFTSELTYAILGDLALTVVFSHGFSMFVALILVPTVRLQLMSLEKPGSVKHSPIEKQLKWLDNAYGETLAKFLERPKLKWAAYGGLSAALALLIIFVLPRLPREIVGMPDTDWITLNVDTDGNTKIKQMELQAEITENELLKELGDKVLYTFTQVNDPNSTNVMARLAQKKDMRKIWKQLEAKFTDTPLINYRVEPWNPSELPIPDPPHLKMSVRGGDLSAQANVADEIRVLLRDKKIYPRVWTDPNVGYRQEINLVPNIAQWNGLKTSGATFLPGDLAELIRVASNGKRIGYFPKDKSNVIDVFMTYPPFMLTTPEDIGSFPIGVDSKIVPLRALALVKVKKAEPNIYRIDGRELVELGAKLDLEDVPKKGERLEQAKAAVALWEKDRAKTPDGKTPPTVTFEDAEFELTGAIAQLRTAVAMSVLLIFLTMLIQFGSFVEPILVLIAVPLGFIGVLISLFVFQSTLSLNSILGVILLNGIAVANSIILVDFIKRLHQRGFSPRDAAVEAARTRLRPILMTSLTTLLGMLPIALGLGEGGRILQPLGISVAGGLWVSMLLTLFLVPALHVSYLEWKESPQPLWTRLRPLLARRRMTIWLLIILSGLAPIAFGEIPESTPESPKSEVAPLTFSEALKSILDRSTAIATQQAALDRVRADNISTHLILLPTLNVTADQTWSYLDPDNTNRRGITGVSTLNLFKFGSDAAAMRAANREEETQEHLLGDTILKTEAAGVKALIDLIQSEGELENLRQSLQIRSESLRIAKERYDRGLAPQQEVDKIVVELENARASYRDAEISVAEAQAELQNLLGHTRVQNSWPWKELLLKDSMSTLSASEDSRLSKRPDWLAAETKVAAAQNRLQESWGKIFPSLDANFTYGLVNSNVSGFVSEGPQWSAGLSLTIPLFDRLENYGSYRAQVHNKMGAEADLERVRRLARSELLAAKSAFTISLNSAKERDKTLATSRDLYKNGLLRFRRGLISADELGRDQERLYSSELLATRGWGMVHSQLTRLCHSVGQRLQACLEKTN